MKHKAHPLTKNKTKQNKNNTDPGPAGIRSNREGGRGEDKFYTAWQHREHPQPVRGLMVKWHQTLTAARSVRSKSSEAKFSEWDRANGDGRKSICLIKLAAEQERFDWIGGVPTPVLYFCFSVCVSVCLSVCLRLCVCVCLSPPPPSLSLISLCCKLRFARKLECSMFGHFSATGCTKHVFR